jgi:hypothetical protein
VSAFSQRSGLNNQLFAPGSKILSANVRGGSIEQYGTSMASPMVAGAVALLQDAAKTFAGRWLSPREVRDILRTTADVIVDGNVTSNRRVDTWFNNTESELVETGLAFRRINVQRAVQFVRQTLSPSQDTDARLTAAHEIPALNGLQVFTTSGSIGRDGATSIGVNDVDLFKVTLASSGAITIRVDPVPGGTAFDPYLRVFDSSGSELASANDSSTPYPGLSSPILPAGTYYVGVSSFNNRFYNPVTGNERANGLSQGDYFLSVSLDNPDPNGVISGAAPAWNWGNVLKDQYSYARGIIGSDPPPEGGTDRIPLGGNDVDMFEVAVPDTGFLNIRAWSYSLLTGGVNPSPFDTFLRVFNQMGVEIAWNDDAIGTLDSIVRIPVSRGERLFIGVSDARNHSYSASDPYRTFTATGGGIYELTSWFENGDTNGSAYGAMETLGTGAASIGVVGLDSGVLVGADGGRDVDFYRFMAPVSGVFDVEIRSPDGSLIPSAALWTWDPLKEECVLFSDASGSTVRHQVYVHAGQTLLVSVTGVGNTGYQWHRVGDGQGGDTGNYAITTVLRPESDWWFIADDSANSPTVPSIALDQWLWGELGQDGALHRGSTDGDIFRFVAPRTGKVEVFVSADFEDSADTFLRVFDATGQELAYNDDVDSQARSSGVVLPVIAGQTYLVGVTGYGTGNLRAYSPYGVLNQVQGSTGSYLVLLSEIPKATLGPIASPTQSAVDSLAITFSKPVLGVDIGDFSLSRNGVAVPLGGAVITGNGSHYTISNLGNLTSSAGTYSLSLTALNSGITDSNGTLLQDSATVTWIRQASPAPTVAIAAVSPSPRTTPVPRVDIVFSSPVTGFDVSDVVLTRDGIGVPLSDVVITGSGSQFAIENLSAATAFPGSYSLLIKAADSGILSFAGVGLAGPTSQSWVMLPNDQPTVAIGGAIPSSVTGPLSSVPIVFSKAIVGFDLNDVSLSLNGTPLALRGVKLVGSGANWSLTLLTTATRALGTYSLTIRSDSGITDFSGSSLGSVTPRSWANTPTASLTGVPAVSPRSITSVAIRFNGNVTGVSLNAIKLSFNGQVIPLTGARVSGSGASYTLSLPAKLTARRGRYTLQVGGADSGIVGGGLALQMRASVTWRRS